MLSPYTNRLPRRAAAAAAALLLGSLTLPADRATAQPSAAAQRSRPLLSCTIRTAPGHPITLTPAVTTLPRTIRVRATLHLSGCRAATAAGRVLRTGTVNVQGQVRASCSSATPLNGKATVTWYTAPGRRAGTSAVQLSGRTVNSSNIGDSLLAGKITSGQLAGAKVSATTTPTSDVTRCAISGLRTLSGSGTVTLTR